MDAAVRDEGGEGNAGHLAADGAEARDENRARGAVDDQGRARRGLDGEDVAALAADDAALDVLVGEVHGRGHRVGRVRGGVAFDGVRDEEGGVAARVLLRLLVEAADEGAGLGADAFSHLVL